MEFYAYEIRMVSLDEEVRDMSGNGTPPRLNFDIFP